MRVWWGLCLVERCCVAFFDVPYTPSLFTNVSVWSVIQFKGTVRHIEEKFWDPFRFLLLPSLPAAHFSSDFACVLECVCLNMTVCMCVCVFHRDGKAEVEGRVSQGMLGRVQWTGISDGRVETSKAHWKCVCNEKSQWWGCAYYEYCANVTAVKNNWL